MKIAYLTAGAAGMFCGSCMHDNALAAALSKSGVDCQLIPTYTPIRTDEQDVSIDQVFFGGINIYLQQKVPLFRHLPGFLDRLLDSPALIRRVTNRASSIDPKELGALTVSMLKGRSGFQRKEVGRLCDWLKTHVDPDVLILSNVLIGGCLPDIHRELGIPTVVTLQGDDIFLESLPEPYREQSLAEISRLADDVDLFLCHSEYYADFMSEYLGIKRDSVAVTPLAIDTSDFQDLPPHSKNDDAPTIGYLARLAPEKGLHQLVDAFIYIHEHQKLPGCRLRLAGWLGDSQKEFAEQQFKRLDDAGLSDSYEYAGAIDRSDKLSFLRSLDMLCVPTTYREPKGLFALESMAAEIPVLVPDHGGFPEMIRDTHGGRLFAAGDMGDLSKSLVEMLTSPDDLRQMGQKGRTAVLDHRDARAMAETTLQALKRLPSLS